MNRNETGASGPAGDRAVKAYQRRDGWLQFESSESGNEDERESGDGWIAADPAILVDLKRDR